MVQHRRACWRAQRGGVLPVLVRTDDLCGEEPGVDGDAYAPLLGASAIPLLQGTRGDSRGVGRKDPGLVCRAPGSPVGQCLASGVNAVNILLAVVPTVGRVT